MAARAGGHGRGLLGLAIAVAAAAVRDASTLDGRWGESCMTFDLPLSGIYSFSDNLRGLRAGPPVWLVLVHDGLF